jgi:predicted permease
VLFGLAPAIRASSIQPLGGLKERVDGYAHRRVTRTLVGAQMTFCVFVLFVTGLFVTTFSNLAGRSLGFEYKHLLLVDAQTAPGRGMSETWTGLMDRLRGVAGVETVSFAQWVPLSQNRWTATVRVPGQPNLQNPSLFLAVAPGFFETMHVGMVAGRDFSDNDNAPRVTKDKQLIPGVGIVNEAFARVLFGGENPIGKRVTVSPGNPAMEIIGLVRDSTYYNVREPMRPTVYVPWESKDGGTLIVRTEGDPLAAIPAVRVELSRARTDFRALQVSPYSTIVKRQMVLERLLAILSLFFATVALLLTGIGLYGVLNYAVIQRRREIGVRMALGARAADVVRRVIAEMLGPVGVGSMVGLAGGLAFGGVIERILFEVKVSDAISIAAPLLTLAVAAALAALPPAVRAVRIDPAQTLRSE